MSIESIMDATRSGLAYERLRMEAASRNIAAANVPVAADAQSANATAGNGFDAHLQNAAQATRTVHDPGHPMADKEGMVHYPATDLVQEMTTLMTASRGYEANVRAFNLLRGMLVKAFELGAK
ncbi:flagellar basal body rod protein FlgC [Arenimonas sp.]|uniref:flagellar basal body rod protein FlgC n=1 Tax=Arenimonas sp. TaxID=1872635 RepID=UPI0039E3E65D